jgi:hypothetical protein
MSDGATHMTLWLLVAAVAFSVLVWTWFLYPLVIWIASRMVRVPVRAEPATLPRVTAIVASRDDAATIAARVADFLRADYPADRLNVVVGSRQHWCFAPGRDSCCVRQCQCGSRRGEQSGRQGSRAECGREFSRR